MIDGARLPGGMLRAMLTASPLLSREAIEAFQRDGFVVVPGLFREGHPASAGPIAAPYGSLFGDVVKFTM